LLKKKFSALSHDMNAGRSCRGLGIKLFFEEWNLKGDS